MEYVLANVYGPNDDNLDFMQSCIDKIELFNVDQKIIGGDFNTVLDISMDKQGGQPVNHKNTVDILQAYMSYNNMVDPWRLMHPDIQKFTCIDLDLTQFLNV